MNSKTRRLKAQKKMLAGCSCIADHSTRTIYLCDNCYVTFNLPKVIHVDPKDRIGK